MTKKKGKLYFLTKKKRKKNRKIDYDFFLKQKIDYEFMIKIYSL